MCATVHLLKVLNDKPLVGKQSSTGFWEGDSEIEWDDVGSLG